MGINVCPALYSVIYRVITDRMKSLINFATLVLNGKCLRECQPPLTLVLWTVTIREQKIQATQMLSL
ncbi:Uncharacterized protein TCM_023746 [Theobroma cacao]|uniref:Uncharacterized protein n=1 Tax=Theobroma cacao TaxID=3641 RepID=A0A061EVP5_THECC|nr:Uncharacterized protein TCM_023746 [Theobroma cacao]